MNNYLQLLGRILLAQIYLIAGIGKILGYAGTEAYMAKYGVPGALLPLVILLEVGGGIAVLIGWQTRWACYALAIFSVIAAVIFHHDIANTMQRISLMSDLAMAGGLLILAVSGPGPLSLDRK
ncbi:MAG: DoxX family protein [Gammaproteobacteria bacterium]|jgi:putative oxidoreductase